ncbi:hypothetical protein ZIOFF_075370 [Zingiber officinale]|uniref:Uncharacterized protein n=1 Tax=Zingiber officinale TaxID=94328 RepID=A0A8J5EKY4_ZINOF|nr:hypothetical protein ZIOFF_075370 [Zingiber officinale]
MCLVRWVYSAEEVELWSEKAPGSCPYCGGAVIAADVESSWWLCCLPLSRTIKRPSEKFQSRGRVWSVPDGCDEVKIVRSWAAGHCAGC